MAQERSDALVGDISRWRKPEPLHATLHTKVAPECGWYIEVDSVDPPPALDRWGVQLGEIAHHLRSILNTTLTRIVAAEGDTPGKRLQYPVTYTAAKWREALKGRMLAGVPERVVRAIYANQPFVWANASGTKPADHVLAVLAWLNNEDKHRIEIGGSFAGRWVAYEGRIITPDGTSLSVRPKLTHDWSLKPGSRIVDADTSPHVVADVGRTTVDLQIDVLVRDETGNVTILEQLVEEIWGGFQEAQLSMMFAWANEEVDYDDFAGASNFKAGSAFGRAAVDAVNGKGTWDNDGTRRTKASALSELDAETTGDEEPSDSSPTLILSPAESHASNLDSERVDWERLRGLRDAHDPPRTWRGNTAGRRGFLVSDSPDPSP